MKIYISLFTWINRVLMLPFVISLFLGLITTEYLYYSAFIAIGVGFSQVISALLTAFFILIKTTCLRYLLWIYSGAVVLFFTFFYLFTEVFNFLNRYEQLIIVFWVLPILLSVLFTYFIETLHKQI